MRTLIIGGGLSGLAIAEALETKDRDYMLIEARNRYGGRIKTEHHGDGYFDMEPAWFWPGQPRIAALIDRLELEMFEQFAEGILMSEDANGQVSRGRGFNSMQGSWRLKGGLAALTQTLADKLPEARKRSDATVQTVTRLPDGVTVTLTNGEELSGDQIVLAMPPRVAAEINFVPPLADNTVQSMRNISMWMAGQSKAVAVYERPFWRDAGLSGDASSRHGPMVEIHDASPSTGGPFALFRFIGVPPQGRTDPNLLREHLIAQLVRLFGQDAATPSQLYVKDWAFDPFTSTQADQAPLYAHPTYGLPASMANVWGDQLHFAGTEVAPQFGGYIEGALEAAENVLGAL